MLEVKEIHTHYGQSHILQGISLTVKPGQVLAVLGRNGVGKTTLVHSLVSFVKPTGGRIHFRGGDITGRPTHQIIRQGLTLVPQGRRVFRSLSVLENLTVPYRCLSPAPNKSWDIGTAFQVFPHLEIRKNQRAGNLSGGEQQMLAMARALVSRPQMVLFDEPSEGLAPMVVKEISKVIKGLADQGLAVLLIEQNFNMALNTAHEVLVMSRGQIVHRSSPQDLAKNNDIKSRYLGM
ncbi:MAG: ABC transporter ATP-binding protein [Deltaproteobacteria bacterium]|nr:ABC transporter ATP-binding protein [Deltaproteobacteria bacterium]